MARAQLGSPRRGEVYLVGFDPTLGAEIKKTRPAVVLVLLNQIRSIDRHRLGRRLGFLKAVTMDNVDRGIQISLGLVKI